MMALRLCGLRQHTSMIAALLVVLWLVRVSPPAAAQSALSNFSTRGFVGTGDAALISSFTVECTAPKPVLIRALGLSLAASGLAGVLADPTLELLSGQTVIATNDNWMDSAQAADIMASGLAPTDAQEAAVLATLAPGDYTVIVRGVSETTGIGLVEVLELEEVPDPANAAPIICGATTTTQLTHDEVGRLIGAVTTITLSASDPDGDSLTYAWSVSNGFISGDGATATWIRDIAFGNVVPGTVTVTVSDGQGGVATHIIESR